MIGRHVPEALALLLDMVRRPRLPASALDPSRDLALQALESLEDEPQQKVFLHLRQQQYPDPFGRSALGQKPHIASIMLQDVQEHWARSFVPGGAILAFAGRIEWPRLRAQVHELLGDWAGQGSEPSETAAPPRGYLHVQADSTQVHIGVAYDAIADPDPRSILQRTAITVLAGGMSGRLGTEVREKRGLCYSVYATYAGERDRGNVLGYAGTTTARAQETLDVLVAELGRIAEGVEPEEFQRARVGMKSGLVMQGESTGARAAAIAADQYVYGHPRTLEDLERLVDSVTLQDLNQFLRLNPPGAMTVVTVGPKALRAAG